MTDKEIKQFFNKPENEDLWTEYSTLNSAITGKNTSREIVAKDIGAPNMYDDYNFTDSEINKANSMLEEAYEPQKYKTKTRYSKDAGTYTEKVKDTSKESVQVGDKNIFGQAADLTFSTDKKGKGKKPSKDTTLLMTALPNLLGDMPSNMDNWEVKEEGGKTYLIESDMFFDDKVQVRWNDDTQSIEWKEDGSRAWLRVDDDFEEFKDQF